MSFRIIQCHSVSSLPVTKLSCSLQLRLLDVSLSLTLSLALPLDEPVVLLLIVDAKEDKEVAPSNMPARLSLHSPDAGSVLLSFLRPPVSLHGLRTVCEVRLLLRGVVPHHFALLRFGLHATSLIWSRYFSGLHFPTMALYVLCDESQKNEPPPPDPDPPSGAKIISIPGRGCRSESATSSGTSTRICGNR